MKKDIKGVLRSSPLPVFMVDKNVLYDDKYKTLNNSSKLLYIYMLAKYSENNKEDENGYYINYSLNDIISNLNIGKSKAIKCRQELVDIGLIYKIDIYLGMPSKIYLLNV